MSDVTQLTDEYLFERATDRAESPIHISKSKSVVSVIDLQQGSYGNGTVTIDATNQLNGANGFASLAEAYITVPYVVSINNVGANDLQTTTNYTKFIGGMKANTTTIVDKVQIEFDGKTLVTPTSYLSHWNNFRAMTEWSESDIKVHGASAMMYPDDTSSIAYSAVKSVNGDGYTNNTNNWLSGHNTVEKPSISVNSGFVKRQHCNPPVIKVGTINTNPYGWASTHKDSAKQASVSSGKGACVIGVNTKGNNVITYYYMLKIRLVDLHPIFKTMDLCANPSLKLTLYINTGTSDIAAPDTDESMRLVSVNLAQGNTCPFMLSSAAAGNSLGNVLSPLATTLRLAWGVMGNDLTSTATAAAYYPYSTTRLWIPFYDLHADKALEIVKSPKKVCRYLDVFTQPAKNLTGSSISTTGTLNSNFTIQVSGNQKNVKYVALIPFASSSTAGLNFETLTNIDQAMSPFDSAPWTCQAGSNISNFNVQVGNSNVFNNPISYDFSGFLDEFSKISCMYGGMDHRLANGLIDEEKWSSAQRIMVADVSRLTDKHVSQSIMISGTNNCSQPSDFVVLVVSEKQFTLDRVTGSIELN